MRLDVLFFFLRLVIYVFNKKYLKNTRVLLKILLLVLEYFFPKVLLLYSSTHFRYFSQVCFYPHINTAGKSPAAKCQSTASNMFR